MLASSFEHLVAYDIHPKLYDSINLTISYIFVS